MELYVIHNVIYKLCCSMHWDEVGDERIEHSSGEEDQG